MRRGLIIALMVPSVAFGATFYPTNDRGTITMEVKRGNGKNKRVKAVHFYQFRVNCPKSEPTRVQTELYEPTTGNIVRTVIAIDAAVRHGRWHFNELLLAAVGRDSAERIDASINFRGKFREHNKNKADGTLEVTLEGVNFGSGPEDCHGDKDFHVHYLRPWER